MRQVIKLLFILLSIEIFGFSISFSQQAERKYIAEKTQLHIFQKQEEPLTILASADHKKFAMAIKNKKKKYVLYDNIEKSREYDALFNLNFSADGAKLAFTAKDNNDSYVVVDGKELGPFKTLLSDTVIFSPDSRRYAFAAGFKFFSDKEEFFVIIDGERGPRFDYLTLEPPRFSPDSKRIIYFVRDKDLSFAMLDGLEGPNFEWTGGIPVFSYDGSLVSYYGSRNDIGFVVVNNSLIGGFYGLSNPVFSPVSLDIAYAAWKERKSPWQVYLNHRPLEKYNFSNHPVFSPDGSRFAFWASNGEKQFAVVDWVEDAPHDSISDIRFTKNSKHYYYLAYLSMKPKRWAFVVDGKLLPEMVGWLERQNIYFSADNSRFAYLWDVDKKNERLVIDDIEFTANRFDDVVFSPDNSRYAVLFKKSKSSQWQLIVDGKEIVHSDYIAPIVAFSPDSRDIAFYVWRDKKVFLVINNQEFDSFDYISPLGVEFNSDGTLIFYATKDNSLYRVTVKPEE